MALLNPVSVLDRETEWRSFSPGLARLTAVLAALDHPHRAYPHVLVGGTNGKGTVTCNLAKQLPGRVGRMTSPHLVDVREQIVVDDQWLPDAVWREAERWILERVPEAELSYFEWLTLLAVVIFKLEGVDHAVFEVGLGGRLDATNALDPQLSILTNVSLDHMEFLGETVEDIACHKIGIARPGRPFVLPSDVNAIPEVARRLQTLGARPVCFQSIPGIVGNLEPLNTALSCLGLSRVSDLEYLPGRRQTLRADPLLLLDGAHNEAAWLDLANWLRTRDLSQLNLLAGMTRGRDIDRFLEIMKPFAKEFAVVSMGHERELPLEMWPKWVKRLKPDETAPFLASNSLITGSLYLVGHFLKRYPNMKQ